MCIIYRVQFYPPPHSSRKSGQNYILLSVKSHVVEIDPLVVNCCLYFVFIDDDFCVSAFSQVDKAYVLEHAYMHTGADPHTYIKPSQEEEEIKIKTTTTYTHTRAHTYKLARTHARTHARIHTS